MPTMEEYIRKRAPELHGHTILRRQHAQREWQEQLNDRVRVQLGKQPQNRYGDDAGAGVAIEGESEGSVHECACECM